MKISSEQNRTNIRVEAILFASLAAAASGVILVLIHPVLLVFSIVIGFAVYELFKNNAEKIFAEKQREEHHALAVAHWVQGIGTLVDAIERSSDSPSRRSEIAELTRILPHVRHHHWHLIDHNHLYHLLRLMLHEADESPEFVFAGLAAIEHLGWIDAIAPLETRRPGGDDSRVEEAIERCLAALRDIERAIHEHDTLVRPVETGGESEATLLRPVRDMSEQHPEQLLRIIEDKSDDIER